MTNPDNVGGLPELPAWMDDYKIPCDAFDGSEDVRLSDRLRAYGELCRAAPAGGELTENERRRAATFKIPQVGWACVSRQQSLPEPADCDWPMCGCDPYADKVIEALQESGVIRDHSAPAGSGEVGAWMHEDDPSRVVSAVQKESNLRDGGASASSMRPYSIPLLRKLQQGADYVMVPRDDLRAVVSVSMEGRAPFHSEARKALRRLAASQGQEGGKP